MNTMPKQGIFITFEGGEGAGKSSHIHALTRALEHAGYSVLPVREPGSSTVSEAIRSILLDTAHAGLTSRAELFLYEAARAQLVDEVIAPALARGEVVLCDRFYDSTTAYQGYARGLSLDNIANLNMIATADLIPDRTIVLDVPVELGLERAGRHGQPDRLESESREFHEAVREGFQAIAAQNPQRVRLVDASGGVLDVWQAIAAELEDLFPELAEEK